MRVSEHTGHERVVCIDERLMLDIGKGVVCQVVEDHELPIDANGVRAEVVMAADSTISRMNIGRLYELYLGSVSNQIQHNVRKIIGLDMETKLSTKEITKYFNKLLVSNPADFETIYQYILGYYALVNEKQYQAYASVTDERVKLDHMVSVVDYGVIIYYPTDLEKEAKEIVKDIENIPYKPIYGGVTYSGNSGVVSTTAYPVRIGTLYMLLLEKIADDWSSVASGKQHHTGILTPVTKSDKYANSFRESPVRTIGETEGRIYAGYCGREAIAEMMDRNNNPETHRVLIKNILTADKPTDIDDAVDRDLVTLGNSKPIQLLRHLTECMGFKIKYEPEK